MIGSPAFILGTDIWNTFWRGIIEMKGPIWSPQYYGILCVSVCRLRVQELANFACHSSYDYYNMTIDIRSRT
jgi:hypothetical protein